MFYLCKFIVVFFLYHSRRRGVGAFLVSKTEDKPSDGVGTAATSSSEPQKDKYSLRETDKRLKRKRLATDGGEDSLPEGT